MKCDDVWPTLESGNWWQRRRASRHLKGCSSCAKAMKTLAQLKRVLSETDAPSAALRAQWMEASSSGPAQPIRVRRSASRFVIGSVAIAAGIVVAVVLWSNTAAKSNRPKPDIAGPSRPGPDRAAPKPAGKPERGLPSAVVVQASSVQVREIDVAEELARLRNDIAQTDAEIRKLAEQAKLRQAGSQLELLIAKYDEH